MSSNTGFVHNLNVVKNTASDIALILDEISHYLPKQAPLHAFVHHNTLHAFEDKNFKDAVLKASSMFKSEPFMSEKFYNDALCNFRIRVNDIEAVISDEIPNKVLNERLPDRYQILNWALTNCLNTPESKRINWWLNEKRLLLQPHPLAGSAARQSESSQYINTEKSGNSEQLGNLWNGLYSAAPTKKTENIELNIDNYFQSHEKDSVRDHYMHFFIKLCSSFLDQGVSNIVLPQRKSGFLESVKHYILTSAFIKNSLQKDMAIFLSEYSDISSLGIIETLLTSIEIPKKYWHNFIFELIKPVKGWAGMFLQYEQHPDKAPETSIPASLADFTSILMLLEVTSAKSISSIDLKNFSSQFIKIVETTEIMLSAVFESFIAAQAFNLHEEIISNPESATLWIAEFAKFNAIERRYLMHLAYERRHRVHILDAIHKHIHLKKSKAMQNNIKFQIVFCMDEREESTRRHLEETDSQTETYGCPGFFGVAMNYKGLDDIKSRPLCPVTINPQHYIEEIPLNNKNAEKYYKDRKIKGEALNILHQGKFKVFSSTLWTLAFGGMHAASLIAHSLVPSFAHHIQHAFSTSSRLKPKTTLKIFRTKNEKNQQGWYEGFSKNEAADIVFKLLNSMGLVKRFAPLIFLIGHGSCSMNNPHEAAHDCGATGGGRGGPNARAFAMLANDIEVRRILSVKGMNIDDSTFFVGAYHNTADDSVEYYDTAIIPDFLIHDLKKAQENLRQACVKSAHERCRKFEDAKLSINNDQALKCISFDLIVQST